MSVLVIGNATRDLTYRVPRLPRPGETLLASQKTVDFGGKGLNQAVAAARAGTKVRFAAAVGADENGRAIAAMLADEPLIEPALWHRDLPSDESIIAVAEGGANHIVSTALCAHSVTPDEVVAALAPARPGDVLVMQGNLSGEATAAGLAAAHRAGLRTALNPAPVGFDVAPMLPFVDVLVANEEEAATLGDPEGAAAALAPGGALVVTLGERGARCHRAGAATLDIPAETVAACDTTGAGDAFVGTLAAGLSRSVPLEAALLAATRSAAFVVTRPGTYAAIAGLAVPDWSRHD